MLVAEIGDDGQAAIVDADAHVRGDGLAGEVATTYASRAGFRTVLAGVDDEPATPAFVVDPSARAVIDGSLSALAALRRVVLRGR